MYHTFQWSMKQESHCSVNYNAQHACKQTEGWPGYLKRNVTVFKTFPLKTHTSMLLRTTKSKLRTGRDNFTEVNRSLFWRLGKVTKGSPTLLHFTRSSGTKKKRAGHRRKGESTSNKIENKESSFLRWKNMKVFFPEKSISLHWFSSFDSFFLLSFSQWPPHLTKENKPLPWGVCYSPDTKFSGCKSEHEICSAF